MNVKPKRNILPAVFLFLFLVLGASLVMFLAQRAPNPLPVTAPAAEFSAERAFQHVQAISHEPHPVGTAAHLQVRSYIVSELQAYGLSPQIQDTTFVDPESPAFPGMTVAGTVQNVIARLAGTVGSQAILFVCHYDSTATTLGASDDGSGVATLLEAARALQAGPPIKNDVIFLFTDGEEVGLLGAQAFVEQHPWAKEVGLVLNFDTGGDTGIVYTYETSPGSARLIAEYAKVVPYPATSSMMSSVYATMPNESDFTPFKRAGMQGFNFAHLGGKFRYHTMTENQANLDHGSIQHHGSYAISLTRHFGNLDLSNLRQDKNPIYFSILSLVVVVYPEAWALPFAILTAFVFVGLVILGWRRKKVSLVRLLLGALAFLLDLVMSAGTAWLIWQVLVKIYPQYGAVVDIHNGFFYWLAFIALTVAITSAFYNLLRRHFRLAELALGALLWWLVATVMLSLLMPGGSYWLEWPLLFSLIGLGLLWLFPEAESASWRRAGLLAATALPALSIFSWSIYAMYAGLGTELIIVPVLLMALMLGLFIPHLDLFARLYRWALPVTAMSVTAVALIAGSITAKPDAANPQVDSIFYALNADTGQALWISEDPRPDVWTSQFLGTEFKRGKLTELFPQDSKELLFAPAPALNLDAPQVKLLDDHTTGDTRTLQMHVTTPGQVPWVEVEIESSGPIFQINLGGKQISLQNDLAQPSPNGTFRTIQYWVPSAQGFDLTIEAAASGKIRAIVRNYAYGLPQIPGFTYDGRPADRMPLAREFLPKNRTDTVLVSKTFAF
jgi:Peptidase family M28